MKEKITSWQELSEPVEKVAPRLLGCFLQREINGHVLVGRIVETEAYDQHDAASHSYHGETARTRIMFGQAGYLYVYFTYGMHYCCNVVTGIAGQGSAVLIRAVEPLEGIAQMTANRGGRTGVEVTNGPAKVCQAFAIDKAYNGHDLRRQPIKLLMQAPLPSDQIIRATRVGISRATEMPWRFYVRGNRFVSKT